MGLLTSTLFQPLITGPLLAVLAYGPSQLQTPLLELLGRQTLVTRNTTAKALSILLALGVLGKVNSFLNSWANNNFRFGQSKKWDWGRGKELAVVTGGSSGIGRAIVEHFAGKGVRVVVLDILPLPKELEENELVEFLKCDLSDAEEIKQVTDVVKSLFGDPSIVINNAGMRGSKSILSGSLTLLQKMFAVNLLSHWAMAQAFLPAMIARDKGHVVSVASMSSFVPMPNGVAYSATKSGLQAFYEGLSMELALIHKSPGVLTSIVYPHWVRTQMAKHMEERIDSERGGMLTVDEVAGPVTEQVLKARGGELIIPENVGKVAGIRGWPSWMAISLRNYLGKLTAGD